MATLNKLGAIAFSVNNLTDLAKITKAWQGANLPWEMRNKVAIQAIPALLDEDTLRALFTASQNNNWRLTLLGYKHSGRGEEFASTLIKRRSDWWVKMWAKEFSETALSIDTTLALSCQKALEAKKVPTWQYHTREGAWSMYVDSVTQTVAASSYDGNGTPLAAGNLTKQLQEAFDKYEGEPTIAEKPKAVSRW
jgi:hypothetical protein